MDFETAKVIMGRLGEAQAQLDVNHIIGLVNGDIDPSQPSPILSDDQVNVIKDDVINGYDRGYRAQS